MLLKKIYSYEVKRHFVNRNSTVTSFQEGNIHGVVFIYKEEVFLAYLHKCFLLGAEAVVGLYFSITNIHETKK